MRHLLYLVFALSIAACGSKKDNAISTPVEAIREISETPTEVLVTDDVDRADAEFQEIASPCLPFELNFQPEPEVQSAKILGHYYDGPCLVIKYQYSGCSEGNLILGSQKQEDGTNILKLYAKDAGPCEMLIQGSASFTVPEGIPFGFDEGKEE